MAVQGLKCDNPECDFVDLTIPRADYESSIGKPCPKCGESLLTQEDYDTLLTLEKFTQSPLAKMMATLSPDTVNIQCEFHGKGFRNMTYQVVGKED